MPNNQYVNKVEKSDGTTLIDITDTTAIASDVASGKDFYLATGEKVTGTSSGGGSVVVVDTPDSHGGTIREITAANTVMLQGQKTVTLTESPQTITPDTGYDGFASVVVDVGQLGAVTQDEDGYLVLSPSGDGGQTGGIVTGSFVLAEDYTYSDSSTIYSGSILINTGLSEIHSIFVIDSEWYNQTAERPCFGALFWFSRKAVGLGTDGFPIAFNGIGGGTAATLNSWSPSVVKTIGPITNEYASNVSAGYFGIKVSASGYPIKAGDTIYWYATGGIINA